LRALVAAAVALGGATGCLEGRRVIRVAPDGSGTIEDTVVLSPEYRRKIDVVRNAEEQRRGPLDHTSGLRQTLRHMGGGVRLVSFREEGAIQRLVFAFDDVRRIRVSPNPWVATVGESPPEQHLPLAFRLAERDTRRALTAVLPDAPPEGARSKVMSGDEWGYLRMVMAGLKLETVIEVEGTVIGTSWGRAEGARLTLLEMDFDRIVANEEGAARFRQAGAPTALSARRLQGIDGLKVPPGPEVTIEFVRR
jgi:hypothetical protein